MKRALILHGTDAHPDYIWFPWLRQKLEEQGYEVWIPQLPGCHTPNRQVYNDFLFGSDWDFADNLVIGHSSGAVSVLNMLMDERCPHIDTGIMVGAWAHMDMTGRDTEALRKAGFQLEQFDDLFPREGFDFELIKSKADEIAFLHGDDDPYCPLEQAQWLAGKLDANITVVPNGRHLGAKFPELPELWDMIILRNQCKHCRIHQVAGNRRADQALPELPALCANL